MMSGSEPDDRYNEDAAADVGVTLPGTLVKVGTVRMCLPWIFQRRNDTLRATIMIIYAFLMQSSTGALEYKWLRVRMTGLIHALMIFSTIILPK